MHIDYSLNILINYILLIDILDFHLSDSHLLHCLYFLLCFFWG